MRPACSNAAIDSRRCLTCFSMTAVISASLSSRRSSTSRCLMAASRKRSVARRSVALARMASLTESDRRALSVSWLMTESLDR
ncbi:Uncharacterised protein [Bordetella pertussis]|nr:Uncharacterised protein [Bordetella pertussis]